MSSTKRKQSKRRKTSNMMRRILKNILLAPARIPRITVDQVDRIMRTCEGVALLFVTVLMIHMAVPNVIGTGIVVIAGTVFVGLLAVILLADYQDKLVEYELYGYRL